MRQGNLSKQNIYTLGYIVIIAASIFISTQVRAAAIEVSMGEKYILHEGGFSAAIINEGVDIINILVDLEVYNSNGQKIYQTFFDNTELEAGTGREFAIYHPANLPPGVYRYAVGVFNPGWDGLIEWYDFPRALTVHDPNEPLPELNVTDSAIQSETFSVGQSTLLSATITNTVAPVETLVDLEVYNEAGDKMAQHYVNNVHFASNESRTFNMNTPTDLPPGRYRFAVGIFQPWWSDLMQWRDAEGYFEVQ